MALITKFSLDDVYKKLKAHFRVIRQSSAEFNAAAAAGSVSFSQVRTYLLTIGQHLAACDALIAQYSGTALQDYARLQEEDPTYAPATDYATMKSAANTVIATIAAALPNNSAHSVSGYNVTEPSFSPAATSTLRGQITALIATLSAP